MAVVALAALLIVFLPFLLVRGVRWWRADGNPLTHRVLIALGLALVFSLVVGLFLSSNAGGMQLFERFGLAKRLTLPVVYSLFFITLLFPIRDGFRFGKPIWWVTLFAVTTASTLVEILVPRQSINLLNVMQTIVLVGGLLVGAAAGMRATLWSERDILAFISIVGSVALISQSLAVSVTPFDVVRVPAAFMLIYAGLTRGKPFLFGLLCLASGAWIAYMNYIAVRSDTSASIAVITQIALCAALLCLKLLPKAARMPLIITGVGLLAWLTIRTGIWRIMLGSTMPSWDVTLAHRAYEAQAVQVTLSNPWNFVFGGGPGATVDLSNSPDVATLLSAGRNITAVDDVHLLTSWLLLKFGVLGIAWFVLFAGAALHQGLRVMRINERFSFDFVLLLFVASAVVTALPAATYLFSNPLMALCMGTLVAREARILALGHTEVPVPLGQTEVRGR